MLLKNTGLTSVDCGGLMLPVGATADLDPGSPVVAEHVAAGRLTAVQGFAGEPGPELPNLPPGARIAVPRQKSSPLEES